MSNQDSHRQTLNAYNSNSFNDYNNLNFKVMSTFLKINTVEIRQDKNGDDYKFMGISTFPTALKMGPDGKMMTVKVDLKSTSSNSWGAREINGSKFKADPSYHYETGDTVLGQIVTRNVDPYKIDNPDGSSREVSQYTCAVFGDDEDAAGYEAKIKSVFARNGFDLEQGTAPSLPTTQNTIAVVNAPAVSEEAKEEAKSL